MKAQLILEWKKQPWLLHLFWFIVLLAVIGSAMVRAETVRTRGVSYTGATADTIYAKPTTASERHYQTILYQHGVANNVAYDKQLKRPTSPATRTAKKILRQFQQRDYLSFNRSILAIIQDDPEQAINDSIADPPFDSPDQAVTQLTYMVKHQCNRMLQLDAMTAVINNAASAFGINGFKSNQNVTTLNTLILAMAMTLFCFVFYKDRREETDTFMQLAPLTRFRQALIRGGITLGLINASLLAASGIGVIILTLIPGHEFGTLLFPTAYTLFGKPVILPLWQAFLQLWLLYNLWFLIIAGLALCLSLVSRNQLVGIFVIAGVMFADKLKLLMLVPLNVQRLLPNGYLNATDVIRHPRDFQLIPFTHSLTVLLVWAAVLIIAAWTLMRLQTSGVAGRFRREAPGAHSH
ncbi:hypothetical protein ACFQ3L_07350 [Lacticaseibacillus jixianensis]|uniref:ABC transporter permease n=1 Tax=Lacticaseibacillus jixianensis TaxID=2486012 RepID=A0ABW4BB15_9LACO|nr:hypothetical protein [Lacticaseibacillus jixianensis]